MNRKSSLLKIAALAALIIPAAPALANSDPPPPPPGTSVPAPSVPSAESPAPAAPANQPAAPNNAPAEDKTPAAAKPKRRRRSGNAGSDDEADTEIVIEDPAGQLAELVAYYEQEAGRKPDCMRTANALHALREALPAVRTEQEGRK